MTKSYTYYLKVPFSESVVSNFLSRAHSGWLLFKGVRGASEFTQDVCCWLKSVKSYCPILHVRRIAVITLVFILDPWVLQHHSLAATIYSREGQPLYQKGFNMICWPGTWKIVVGNAMYHEWSSQVSSRRCWWTELWCWWGSRSLFSLLENGWPKIGGC